MKVEELLVKLRSITTAEDVGLTSIGITELVHGIYRAESPERARNRRLFLEGLISDLPVFDYTLEVALLAGRIDAEETMRGNIIPYIDLLIGATALHHGYSVLTTTLRHFRLIPGLEVIPF
jgi:predicted nucleic acid-binding protein